MWVCNSHPSNHIIHVYLCVVPDLLREHLSSASCPCISLCWLLYDFFNEINLNNFSFSSRTANLRFFWTTSLISGSTASLLRTTFGFLPGMSVGLQENRSDLSHNVSTRLASYLGDNWVPIFVIFSGHNISTSLIFTIGFEWKPLSFLRYNSTNLHSPSYIVGFKILQFPPGFLCDGLRLLTYHCRATYWLMCIVEIFMFVDRCAL